MGFSAQIKNNLDKLFKVKEGTKLSEICITKSLSADNDESELKRKRTRMASDDFERENSRNMKPSGGKGKKVKGEKRTGENIASLISTTNLPLKFNEYISAIGDREMWPEAEGIQGVMGCLILRNYPTNLKGSLILATRHMSYLFLLYQKMQKVISQNYGFRPPPENF